MLAAPKDPKNLIDLINAENVPIPCWIEPAILTKGGTFIFGGQTGVGKSFLMLEFARALAGQGKLFECDYFTVPESARVLLIEQELGEYLLADRVKHIFKEEDKDKINDRLWFVSKEQAVKLHLPEGRALVNRWCDEVQPNVLILDPIGKMHSYDESANTEIAKMFNWFDELKQRHAKNDLSVILSHHFSKPSADARMKRDDLDLLNFRGAAKFTDDPDSIMTVKRTVRVMSKDPLTGKQYKWWRGMVSFEKLRAGEPLDHLLLTWNEKNDRRVRFIAWVKKDED